MSWTLESAACPQCQTENSVHIEQCHACRAPLPWAGSEATQILTNRVQELPVAPEIRRETSYQPYQSRDESEGLNPARLALIAISALICIAGVCLWFGNVLGFFPTISGAGYLTFLVGVLLFRFGNRLI